MLTKLDQARPLPSTPADLKSTPGQPARIPEDLLRQASRRLGIMALIAASLWVIANILERIASGTISSANYGGWADRISAASALGSLGLFYYARRTTRDPHLVLDLGLVWLIVMSLAIGAVMHWGFDPTGVGVGPVISWIGPVMLMFAAIVPTTPKKMLVAGLVAASMDPIGMWVAQLAGGHPIDNVTDAIIMHYPNYLMAGIAMIISHIVTRLGREVAKAREMGSYQLGEMLGRGGMGEVYRATHRMLARPAAIKLIRPEMMGAGDGEARDMAARRFRREAEVAASLRSPHTVELYDFGVTEDRTLYFVMELLEGLDLETLVRQFGPVPAARAVHILLQICESLEEAHRRGLVHRDIKPANIHLGPLGVRNDFVKVLDFGLVKSVVGSTGEHSLATATGLTPGTPAYMAPETALGNEVDARADLYAVGCVAYYLLTGQRVFDATNSIQLIAKHLQDVPVPPSQRTELEIPAAMDVLVLDCIAKRPEDRPQTASEVSRRLADIPLKESWTEERAGQWWTVNRPQV